MTDRAELPFLRPAFVTAFLVVLVSSGVALLVAQQQSDMELRKALYGGAVGLVFAGLLGGVVKLLLDESTKATQRREDAANFVRNLLADLKSVYDRVGRARILIAAHQSASTYGSEMRDLIDARVKLRNIARALIGGAAGLSPQASATLGRDVKRMEQYLERLLEEFSDRYRGISELQSAYEKRVEARNKAFATSSDDEPGESPNLPWRRIVDLPLLRDFLEQKRGLYFSDFEAPLDDASAVLRGELSRILGFRKGRSDAVASVAGGRGEGGTSKVPADAVVDRDPVAAGDRPLAAVPPRTALGGRPSPGETSPGNRE